MDPSSLLVNLALALAVAIVGAASALRLRQSVILGYLLAGVAIGPFTPGVVGDIQTVEALANIGIILLMFTIGIQLSLRDLVRAGRVAIGGGTLQVLAMIGLGAAVGHLLGWQPIESLFFGAVLSNSSSTVLSKVLDERGAGGAPEGRLALAWSTVQDLSTIVLVVVLSALAAGRDNPLEEVGLALAQAAIFLVLVLPVGSWVLPRLFLRIAALGSREVFVLSVAAVALGVAWLASLFGLSLALGAFVAGVVVAESDLSSQILGEAMPLRDLFAGLFFVSIGMLVDPLFAWNNLALVLLTAALIVIAKGALSAALAWALRVPLIVAVPTGALLAQSAEFSFLLARLGSELGAVSSLVFNVMLAGSVISIVLAAPVYEVAKPLARWAQRRLPPSPLATLPPSDDAPRRGHVVICGFGQVGSAIAAVLERRGLRWIAIDLDQRVVERGRERGGAILLGDAALPVVLDQTGLKGARALVIAVPDTLTTRRIVDYARQINPHLTLVARAPSREERDYLVARGVTVAVVGELEAAAEMARFTLQRFGISAQEARLIARRVSGAADED
ncbi:MAG: cation:proton antiporter [Chloroflexota bacterium]|nr:cation:proton antiporter [Dehalococcoidia bacterium]MDW8255269.1 cation:proton antiporter [Chloroflexota bacterium]